MVVLNATFQILPCCSAKEAAVHLAVHPAAQIQTTEELLATIQIIIVPCVFISYYCNCCFIIIIYYLIIKKDKYIFFWCCCSWLADTRNVNVEWLMFFFNLSCGAVAILLGYTLLHIASCYLVYQ